MRILLGTAVLTVCAGALAPVAAQGNPVVAEAMRTQANGRFVQPLCPSMLKPDSKVVAIQTALKTGIEDKDAAKRQKALDDAIKAGREATKGNPKSGGAWYYLGRTALVRGEAALADSALTQAEQLAPDCAVDIDNMRKVTWLAAANAAIDQGNAGKAQEAIESFRVANFLYRGLPQGFAGLAGAFEGAGQTDSAIFYFSKALDVAAADTSLTGERNRAAFNLAIMQQRAKKHQDAVTTLQRYLGWQPADARAKRMLAASYRELGKNEDAAVLEKEVLAAGTDGGADAAVSPDDLFNIGVTFFNEKKYAEAADAFDKVLKVQPTNRDALANRGLALNLAGKPADAIPIAKQLLTREPYSEDANKLLVQSLRDAKADQAELLKAVEVYFAMPVAVSVKNMTPGPKGGFVEGAITGREAKDMKGVAVKAVAITLVFELTDDAGAVVTSQEVAVEALPPGQAKPFKIDSGGKPFSGYRYAKK